MFQSTFAQFSHLHNGDMIEAHLKMQHRDGWFSDDTTSFLFNLTTPYTRLEKLRFTLETHGDPAEVDFVEAEWGELKVKILCFSLFLLFIILGHSM